MRTKTLVLSTVIGLASIGASMAQVYSLNTVGYVNSTVPPGFSIIANPLNTTNNSVVSLLSSAPAGTRVMKWTGLTYAITVFTFDDDGNPIWSDPTMMLNPGEGFFIQNPQSTNITITWVGEVMQGALTNAVPVGYSLRASAVPQSGALDTLLGYTPTAGDRIMFFRGGIFSPICVYTFDDDGNPIWSQTPVPNVAEGFFIQTTTAKDWIRNFTVN